MPSLDGKDLLTLKGGGGEYFARFVDRLIRAEAHSGGLLQSEIDTQVRVNIGDGGVDTTVRSAVPADKSGFLGEPTCWQFKAETAAELRARKTTEDPFRFLTVEVAKPEVRRLLVLGHAFRFCFVGDLPPADVNEWESHLLTECRKVNVAAATPRVIPSDKLAAWADRFPAIGSLVKPFTSEIFNLDNWRPNVRAVTPTYVPFGGWESIAKAIIDHVTSTQVTGPCLSVQGEAGVGKTRLVFETLATLAAGASLVIYTRDEKVALTLSLQLATDSSVPSAIVVADECSLQKRMMIEQNIMGCRNRIRFICLSNTGDRGPSGASEIWLEEMPRDVVERILTQNFPLVPTERRSAYIDLAGGFIRLSADMCERNDQLSSGNLDPILNRVADYVRFRLRNIDEERVLNSLSLFTRIGAKDDVAPELESLCSITGMTPSRVIEIAHRIKDSPGFINVAGRFLYVTPAIVARVAFVRGWDVWVRDNPQYFMGKLPPTLLEAFLDRVRLIATPEVKAVVADTFRDWISSRRPEDLNDIHQVERLTTLVETDPEKYLLPLKRLIDLASSEVLLSSKGYGRSSRRQIVWVCERLAAFAAFYFDCEAILFRLSIYESEPQIGNNATHIWRQLQRIFLSGTSVSFDIRFAHLEQRLAETTGDVFELCMKAVEASFQSNVHRMGAPSTIGGRLRPEDWQPKTNDDLRECWGKVLAALRSLACGPDEEKGTRAVEAMVKNLHAILHSGFASDARDIFASTSRSRKHVPSIIETIEDFLQRSAKLDKTIVDQGNEKWIKYLSSVHAWLVDIKPTSFSGKLHTLLSRNPWHESVRDLDGKPNPNLTALAEEALNSKIDLEAAMPFLISDAAKVAVIFGSELGRLDGNLELISRVFGAIERGGNISLARGYLFSVLRSRESAPPEIEEWLVKIGSVSATAGIELRSAGGEKLHALKFAIESVDRGELPIAVLSRFPYVQRLSLNDVKSILQRLSDATESGIEGAFNSSIQFLSAICLEDERNKTAMPMFQDDEVRAAAWRILDTSPADDSHKEDYERADVISKLSAFEPTRAASTLLHGMLKKGYGSIHDHLLNALLELIPKYPSEIIQTFGEAMLDREKGTALSIGEAAEAIIRSFPSGAVLGWLRKSGIEAVRAFARELPLPFVDKENSAIVPRVTLEVLAEYGADEKTCEAFVRGGSRGASWWGNGGDFFRAKAAAARRFVSHENRCVRQWAELEVKRSEEQAKAEQMRFEERMM